MNSNIPDDLTINSILDNLRSESISRRDADEIANKISGASDVQLDVFLEKEGIPLLFIIIRRYVFNFHSNTDDGAIVKSLLEIVKALLNVSKCREAIMKYSCSGPTLIQVLALNDGPLAELAVNMITFLLSNINEGDVIDQWIEIYSYERNEKYKLETIMQVLQNSDVPEVVLNILFFINISIKNHITLFKRMTFRSMFYEWNIYDVMYNILQRARDNKWKNIKDIISECDIFIEDDHKDTEEATLNGVDISDAKSLPEISQTIPVDYIKYIGWFVRKENGEDVDSLCREMEQDGLDASVMKQDVNKIAFFNIPYSECFYSDSNGRQEEENDMDHQEEDATVPVPASVPTPAPATCPHKYTKYVDYKYYKYFEDKKHGCDPYQIKRDMKIDGMDPSILDLDMNTVGFENIPDGKKVKYPDGHVEPCTKK